MTDIVKITRTFKEYDYMIYNAIETCHMVIATSRATLGGFTTAVDILSNIRNIYLDAGADLERKPNIEPLHVKDLRAYARIASAIGHVIAKLQDFNFEASINEIEEIFHDVLER